MSEALVAFRDAGCLLTSKRSASGFPNEDATHLQVVKLIKPFIPDRIEIGVAIRISFDWRSGDNYGIIAPASFDIEEEHGGDT